MLMQSFSADAAVETHNNNKAIFEFAADCMLYNGTRTASCWGISWYWGPAG